MKISKNKAKIATMALILILTISAALIADLSVANAQSLTFDSHAFVSVRPNPVGVNQPVLIVYWLNEPCASAGLSEWIGFTVTITKPNGNTQTLGPFKTAVDASWWLEYTVDQVGTYQIQSHFAGEKTPWGDFYKPSDSETIKLVVQQDPIPSYQEAPLPTNYWERPISAQNRDWYQIGGNWLMPAYNQVNKGGASTGQSMEAPYTVLPDSAHILWTMDFSQGGLMGGESGTAGQNKPIPEAPIAMNGKLYFNEANRAPGGSNEFSCVDLNNGKLLWIMPGSVDFGQMYQDPGAGVTAASIILWGNTTTTTWVGYDAYNGKQLFTLTGAQLKPGPTSQNSLPPVSGWTTIGPKGEILFYQMTATNLLKWNSTLAGIGSGSRTWKSGIQYNVTIPQQGNGNGPYLRGVLPGSTIIAECLWTMLPGVGPQATQNIAPVTSPPTFTHIMYNEVTGAQMWAINRTDLGDLAGRGLAGSTTVTMNSEMYSIFPKWQENYAYSVATGALLWKTTPLTDAWDMYKSGNLIASNGILYEIGYQGSLHAYDTKDGSHLWDTSANYVGYESPYGVSSVYGGFIYSQGKIVYSDGMHSTAATYIPMYRDYNMYVINATTGQQIWNMTGWFPGYTTIAADSKIIGYSDYIGQLVCFGKGQSDTTVAASPAVSVYGNSVLITGAVTDQSPAQPDTPAIADKYQGVWQAYLHMQQPIPSNATGVEVSLDTIDPNGNYVHIGKTTSDLSGSYSLAFTPEVPGKYTIIATFAGSAAYGSSSAETAINVDQEPQTAAPLPEKVLPPTEMYIAAAAAGIIIAIAIGFAVTILTLRKRQ